MATLNFLYRSTRSNAALNVRLLYRDNSNDFVIGAKTKLNVSKQYWKNYHNQKSPKDIEVKNMQTEVRNELNKIENHIVKAFIQEETENVNKAWLEEQLNNYYNPKKKSVDLPTKLIPYFEYYLIEKQNDLATQTLKNYKVIKRLLVRYESSIGKEIKIVDVDTAFKNSFEHYSIGENYSINTIARALQSIKAICNHAKYNGLETSIQLERIKTKETKVDNIYLTFEELNILETLDKTKLSSHLLNARDWLIVSCYIGQRVSDFMRFNKKQIRKEKNNILIEFTQKKTGKIMTVPLHPKVLEILKKRNGDFPKSISSQKYNDYIKTVCEVAKFNKKVKGSKLIKMEEDSKFFYRKEVGKYEKWELVTSHIGRRSFATNYYGKIPTSHLMYMTGHSTEVMFLKYIGKSNKDMAMEITKYFNKV